MAIEGFEEPEIRITLNTENGSASFETEKITGELNAIITDSPNKVYLLVESELGYPIISRPIQGAEYLCPRARTFAAVQNLQDVTTFDKFLLNEKIKITITGQNNTEVSMIFRFD
jgi:hypothetical protein